jgi:pilus assembly protein CpaC
VNKLSRLAFLTAMAFGCVVLASGQVPSEGTGTLPVPAQGGQRVPRDLAVAAGKSVLIESEVPIERVSVGYGDVAEAKAVAPREVLLNGKTPGQTSLIIWQRDGGKLFYDVTVTRTDIVAVSRLEAMQRELKRELPDQELQTSFENETVFLRGHVKDLVSGERAVGIASTLGKTVNLLYVDVPAAEAQILLKVRFGTIDRNASIELGLNLVSTGAANTVGRVSTEQFSPPQVAQGAAGLSTTLSDALNIFLLRPDLNLLATIKALQRKSLFEILAEPNVLAMNGKPASFLAGGEFPYPSFQAGSNGAGAVTIQFREFGVRLNFTPVLTPRGSVRLQVAPEVSALDFTSGLVVQGFNIPALTVRRVSTEIELEPGQSFAIGGLIDNRLTETIAKLPVLGDMPVLGKLFQSKSRLKENTELLIIVTPEVVTPIASGRGLPEMKYPQPVAWPKTVQDEVNPISERPRQPERVPFESLARPMQQTGADTGAYASTPGAAKTGEPNPIPRPTAAR